MSNENALKFYAQVGFQIIKADRDALPPNYTLRDTRTEQYIALVDLTKNKLWLLSIWLIVESKKLPNRISGLAAFVFIVLNLLIRI